MDNNVLWTNSPTSHILICLCLIENYCLTSFYFDCFVLVNLFFKVSQDVHINFINSWNLQSWSSVALTNWGGKNILSTSEMPSSAWLHVASHHGPFGFMNLSLWSLTPSISVSYVYIQILIASLDMIIKILLCCWTGMCPSDHIRLCGVAFSECYWLHPDINQMAMESYRSWTSRVPKINSRWESNVKFYRIYF